MAPTQRLDDRARLAIGKIEAVIVIEHVGLQNAGVAGQMPLGMPARPIARGVEQRRRRSLAAEEWQPYLVSRDQSLGAAESGISGAKLPSSGLGAARPKANGLRRRARAP
jgi:hypothetical protein